MSLSTPIVQELHIESFVVFTKEYFQINLVD
jgi:hypothetical protein